MKKYLLVGLVAISTLTLISWGFVGHKVTASIAEDYLTPQAKAAIKDLLGNQSIADVASWADDVRSTSEYKYTAPYHFLNVESGMNYEQFAKTVKALPGDNVYTAINSYEAKLKSTTTSKEEKAIALKFLVHLVGDAHQPMHVSRAEDKGGNTIQVQFDGKGTNLHTLWDSRLIDYEGLSENRLVAKLEKQITPNDPGAFQKDELMKWLFESYSASTQLYEEVAKNNKLDESYYRSHIGLAEERLVAGGLRLAGILNDIFKGNVVSATSKVVITDVPLDPNMKFIEAKDAATHIGEMVSITAKAYSSRDMGSMTLVNLGAAYPDQLLTVVLRGEAKSKDSEIDGKMVRVEGKLIDYKGKPEIIITDAKDFSVVVVVGDGHSGRRVGG